MQKNLLYLLLLLFLPSCMLTENFQLSKKNRHFDSYECYFSVLEGRELSKDLDVSVQYFSFYKGKIVQNKGVYIGKLLHGEMSKLREDGKVAEQGSFFLGTKNDKWRYWNEKGDLYRMENWSMGKMNGKAWEKDRNGVIHHLKYDDHMKQEEKIIYSDSLQVVNKFKKGKRIASDTIRPYLEIVKVKPEKQEIEKRDTLTDKKKSKR